MYDPIEVAVAISLYAHNVSPAERAQRIYDHFEGECMDLVDLRRILTDKGEFAATELPLPSARAYVGHALAKYGEEAIARIRLEDLSRGRRPNNE